MASNTALREAKPDKWLYQDMVSCSRSGLDIRVTQQYIKRALRIWDTLLKCFVALGHSIETRYDSTYVKLGDHDFKILMREKTKREIVKGTSYDSSIYAPTGILYFRIDSYPRKEWKDGKLTLEQQLVSILAHLEISCQYWTRLRADQKKTEDARKKKERIQQELQQRKKDEMTAFKNLLGKSKRWHKAVNLRNYINELEAKAIHQNEMNDELIHWLSWARKKADWYDPFIEAEDEWLDAVQASL